MDLYEISTQLNEKIEKLQRVVTDETPLIPAKRQAKRRELQYFCWQISSYSKANWNQLVSLKSFTSNMYVCR